MLDEWVCAVNAVGEVKIIALLVLSATLLGESKEFTLKMTVGCAACCCAVLAMHSRSLHVQECRASTTASNQHATATAAAELMHLWFPCSCHLRAALPAPRHCLPASLPQLPCSVVLAMVGFALYSYAQIQKLRQSGERTCTAVLLSHLQLLPRHLRLMCGP